MCGGKSGVWSVPDARSNGPVHATIGKFAAFLSAAAAEEAFSIVRSRSFLEDQWLALSGKAVMRRFIERTVK
jgi:hypothetical protein